MPEKAIFIAHTWHSFKQCCGSGSDGTVGFLDSDPNSGSGPLEAIVAWFYSSREYKEVDRKWYRTYQ